jgi:hypothetical protein
MHDKPYLHFGFVLDALKDESEKKDKVPMIKDILKLRLNDESEMSEDYMYFCCRFLKSVVGVQAFNRGMRMKASISRIATPSDEALALLLLENSHYRWSEEYEKKARNEEVKDDELPPPKYTNAGNKKLQKGFTKKYGGWSNAGLNRYNELYNLVMADRQANGNAFDDFVLHKWSINNNMTAQQQDGGGAGNSNLVIAANDLYMGFGGGPRDRNDDDGMGNSDNFHNNNIGRKLNWETIHQDDYEDHNGEENEFDDEEEEIREQQSVLMVLLRLLWLAGFW